jgi:hypothetical protein
MNHGAAGKAVPDFTEPVIGRAFARPVGSIRATKRSPVDEAIDLAIFLTFRNRFDFCRKSAAYYAYPVPQEGMLAASLTLGQAAVDALCCKTCGTDAYGEIVWS